MNLEDQYQNLRREATTLAGEPSDIPQRAAFLHEIFLDSFGNHGFAEVATHGALWGFRFFETTGTLGKLISYRYFYNPKEMKYRHGLLQMFADGFKTANRAVFIDTYSNYYFTKQFGEEKTAEEILKPDLLDALREIHRAAKTKKQTNLNTRRKLFQTTLQWEQETTVAPKVKEEIAKFDCPILRNLVLKPIVRFKYFPRFKFFRFKNFSNTDERIRKAHESFEVAEKAGWENVFSSMGKYNVMDKKFFGNPAGFASHLKEKLL
ncbi:MAG: hypothetical protein ABIP06_03705 [Pyrinomonadaceae bacterium]